MPTEYDCVRHLAKVRSDRLLALQETVALGLLVARKWNRAGNKIENPTAQDAVTYGSFTDDEIEEFRSNAGRMVSEYARLLPSPGCSVSRSSWWLGVGQSLAAAFIYSFILVVISLFVKLFGSDLITILRFLIGPT